MERGTDYVGDTRAAAQPSRELRYATVVETKARITSTR